MKRSSTSTAIVVSPETESQSEKGTRLYAGWLVLARTLWVALLILAVSVSGASLLVYWTLLKKACIPVYYYSCLPEQLSPESVQSLKHLGITIGDYAMFVFVLSMAIAIIWFVVGLVIFWRKSDDWVALLVSSALITHTGDFSQSYSSLQFLNVLAQFFSLLTLLLVCFLFPNGRFVPRWLRWPAIVGLVWILDPYIFPDSFPLSPYYWPFPLYTLLLSTLLGACVFSQIYRYKRVSSLVQRQQTKWVIYGLSVTLLGILSEELIFQVLLAPPAFLYQLVYMLVWVIIPVLIPLSFGIALLRYRLWDIDILINRTLVYGTLSGLLALIYVGSILLLQFFLSSFTAGNSLAIVASTLAIAALFQPLRHRIQAIIDRHFYRRKYDAARTLAAFSTTLRNEVDLNQLSEHLIAVVQETMQPRQVSLWLRPPERDTTRRAPWSATPPGASEEVKG